MSKAIALVVVRVFVCLFGLFGFFFVVVVFKENSLHVTLANLKLTEYPY